MDLNREKQSPKKKSHFGGGLVKIIIIYKLVMKKILEIISNAFPATVGIAGGITIIILGLKHSQNGAVFPKSYIVEGFTVVALGLALIMFA